MSDNESPGEALGGAAIFVVWLVLLLSSYWWVAILIALAPVGIYLAIKTWEDYQESELYRYRKAARHIQRMAKDSRRRIDGWSN